jgi:hypothetical protein
MQLFSVSRALKFDLDVIETFCFLPLKAEIHALPVAKFYINRRAIGTAVPVYTFRAVENNRLAKNGLMAKIRIENFNDTRVLNKYTLIVNTGKFKVMINMFHTVVQYITFYYFRFFSSMHTKWLSLKCR